MPIKKSEEMEFNKKYTSKVTRFEVIDHRGKENSKGRVLVEYDVKVELSLQDDERTLKVFLTER